MPLALCRALSCSFHDVVRGGGGHTGFFLRKAQNFRDVVRGGGGSHRFLSLGGSTFPMTQSGGHAGFFPRAALFHDIVTPPPQVHHGS